LIEAGRYTGRARQRLLRRLGTCREGLLNYTTRREECTATTHLVFPFRGVSVRHVGDAQAVVAANRVLFFNATESEVRSFVLRFVDENEASGLQTMPCAATARAYNSDFVTLMEP
jgi:hypothetical protein